MQASSLHSSQWQEALHADRKMEVLRSWMLHGADLAQGQYGQLAECYPELLLGTSILSLPCVTLCSILSSATHPTISPKRVRRDLTSPRRVAEWNLTLYKTQT